MLPRFDLNPWISVLASLCLAASPAMLWMAKVPALRDGVPDVLAQVALGLGLYVLIRITVGRSVARAWGLVLADISSDGRLVVHSGRERIGAARVRQLLEPPYSRRGNLVRTLGYLAVFLGLAAVLVCGATVLFAGPWPVLCGILSAVGLDLTRLSWHVLRLSRVSDRGLLHPALVTYVGTAWVITSGEPYPVQGVPTAHLRENLRRHPALGERVRAMIHRDLRLVQLAQGAAVVGVFEWWLT